MTVGELMDVLQRHVRDREIVVDGGVLGPYRAVWAITRIEELADGRLVIHDRSEEITE